MRSPIVIALGVLAAVAAAARENPFNNPSGGYRFAANMPTTLSWEPTTDGTVTLKLQKAGNITPSSGITIAANIPNSGSYVFVPSASLGPGSDYTIEIIDDNDPDNINFTPQFSITGTTGTATELTGSPTVTGSASVTPSSSPASSEADSSSMITSTVSSASTTTTVSSDAPITTSEAATSSSQPTATPSTTDIEAIPDPNGAAALSFPAVLLSGVLGLMAFL
ncbi:hypothetical protein D8B26_001114 [Coccidioides posadasii str. Silveira]|uniref:Uncharacterized protein n=2 Tax=Coccidioides posadasii TaxID=199306 RepID=E9CTM2_COCPS|nr:hypothetical protein CPC735_038790 [Coccidioides posadasii C735 delta SOWgp]EER28615.1 hypothetical protein CPC735_038790 [Coccidioides posadasii C735 delta SOWgp]EFW22167.1 hypothetical protein CPSG_00066 [Coccidioides posadasii str. Silveira]QVM06401.1 hypothetical protein D8B26_001114 [Coccidioides posadasii str. Silveira]|eukprot:XP_003070760.1 hypothetical protein CPC735_038790 [Coccidioides posadasii C735 delta SOWgp]